MNRWAINELLKEKPAAHIDVGSSIAFLSIASLICPTTFVDIRPIKTDFDNFQCLPGDILNLPFSDNSTSSLSCLHVVEHIGLGRYGDQLDLEGSRKACLELARVLKPGGRLYFALPIGKNAVFFNAHRVHDPNLILKYFSQLQLLDFSAVDDNGNFIKNAELKNFCQSKYACGMFIFSK